MTDDTAELRMAGHPELTVWTLACWLAGAATGKAWGFVWPNRPGDYVPVAPGRTA